MANINLCTEHEIVRIQFQLQYKPSSTAKHSKRKQTTVEEATVQQLYRYEKQTS